MKISRVIIKNWRSIKEIDFCPSDMTVLVGANNAGKTNILSAINFILGERWPMPGNLLDSDFYANDRERAIFIRIDFLDCEYGCLVFDTSKPQYNLSAYDSRNNPIRGFNNDQRAMLAFAYVDAGRSFERQFGTSRFTLFGQAIRHLHADLRRDGEVDRLPKLRAALNEAHDILRTDLYRAFEASLRDAFTAQLRTARYDVQFEFRTLDETNLYRGLYPTLIERGEPRTPNEVGSGVRNLLVLALFHAFADAFKGGAVLGIEEPELYLHPHAQRSLMEQFEGIIAAGNQLFISSHSATFLDITNSNRIILVERRPDSDGEICTQIHTSTPEKLLAARKSLYPQAHMTAQSVQAFLRNVRTVEMAEAFFARLIVIVEGPSEREALPILCGALGLNFDREGISIVTARGKTVIDTLVHLYHCHEIKTYVIFDNDKNKQAGEREFNKILCRLFGIDETDLPAAVIADHYAIMDGDWEGQMEIDVNLSFPGLYQTLAAEARASLQIRGNKNKPLVARYVAERLVQQKIHLPSIVSIVSRLKAALSLNEPPLPLAEANGSE